MSGVRRLAGAANPNFGKPWGNALGGFKNQPRIAGRFATSSQVKAYSRIKASGKVKGNLNRSYAVRAGIRHAGSTKVKGVTAGVTGGVIAAAFIANKLNPSFSVSRKRIKVGIRPTLKIGPLQGFSNHEIGIERKSNDFIDSWVDSAKSKSSKALDRRVQKGSTANKVIRAVASGNGDMNLGQGSVKIDGSGLNRRFRYSGGKARPVPGAPASSAGGRTAAKPQGKRQGAKTITNATKGSGGAVRPQRRGGGKKRKKAKK